MQNRLKIGGGKPTNLHHEIGSTYWLGEQSARRGMECVTAPFPNIKGIKGTFTSTCRSGIRLALQQLTVKRKVALIPSFTCESVLVPFLREGYAVFPYPILRNFSVNKEDFLKYVREKEPGVVLIHRYFGFDTFADATLIIQDLRAKGIIVIEDLTQTMYSDYPLGRSNYLVGSIRKWFPIPDGAFVSSIYKELPEDTELVEAKFTALCHKGQYIEKGEGEKNRFREEFTTAERILDSRNEPYAISSISRAIISQTDIDRMKETRWKNYFYLSNHISAYDELEVLLPLMSSEITPFMLPVFVKSGRKELQKFLATNNIYATIIWGCPPEFENKINADAHYIYDHILCFHCDQRYTITDMERIASVIKSYYNEQQ